MNCEIVCVGTELLLGDIVNTNAAWLAKQLAELGITVYYQSVVGDNPARLKNVLESAFARADLVLTTGGLGPTKDDLTKETAASLMGARLALHEPSLAHIETVFSQGGRTVTESVKKQAYLPEGCIPLHNPAGTAPGFILEKGGKTLIMLPGPPREMTAMFNAGVRPHFASEDGTYLFSRRIRIMGIGESDVADMVGDLMDGANPTVAPYAKNTETELRVTAAAATQAQADEMIAPVVEEIRRRVGRYIYGIDVNSVEERCMELLLESGRKAAFAESCTGGLVAKRLTDLPGASAVFDFGAVTYSNAMKAKALGIDPGLIEEHGAVSEQVARAMAEGVRAFSGSDVGIGITGVAGPDGGTEDKPVGTVYIGLADGRETRVQLHRLGSKTRGRDMIRMFAASRAFDMLRRYLEDTSAG